MHHGVITRPTERKVISRRTLVSTSRPTAGCAAPLSSPQLPHLMRPQQGPPDTPILHKSSHHLQTSCSPDFFTNERTLQEGNNQHCYVTSPGLHRDALTPQFRAAQPQVQLDSSVDFLHQSATDPTQRYYNTDIQISSSNYISNDQISLNGPLHNQNAYDFNIEEHLDSNSLNLCQNNANYESSNAQYSHDHFNHDNLHCSSDNSEQFFTSSTGPFNGTSQLTTLNTLVEQCQASLQNRPHVLGNMFENDLRASSVSPMAMDCVKQQMHYDYESGGSIPSESPFSEQSLQGPPDCVVQTGISMVGQGGSHALASLNHPITPESAGTSPFDLIENDHELDDILGQSINEPYHQSGRVDGEQLKNDGENNLVFRHSLLNSSMRGDVSSSCYSTQNIIPDQRSLNSQQYGTIGRLSISPINLKFSDVSKQAAFTTPEPVMSNVANYSQNNSSYNIMERTMSPMQCSSLTPGMMSVPKPEPVFTPPASPYGSYGGCSSQLSQGTTTDLYKSSAVQKLTELFHGQQSSITVNSLNNKRFSVSSNIYDEKFSSDQSCSNCFIDDGQLNLGTSNRIRIAQPARLNEEFHSTSGQEKPRPEFCSVTSNKGIRLKTDFSDTDVNNKIDNINQSTFDKSSFNVAGSLPRAEDTKYKRRQYKKRKIQPTEIPVCNVEPQTTSKPTSRRRAGRPAKISPEQVPPTQVSLAQASPAQVRSSQVDPSQACPPTPGMRGKRKRTSVDCSPAGAHKPRRDSAQQTKRTTSRQECAGTEHVSPSTASGQSNLDAIDSPSSTRSPSSVARRYISGEGAVPSSAGGDSPSSTRSPSSVARRYPSGAGPAPLSAGGKLCGVCGDTAKSMHFGGMACDSCKAFFRRSVQGQSFTTFSCSADQKCIISKKNRKNCQYCR